MPSGRKKRDSKVNDVEDDLENGFLSEDLDFLSEDLEKLKGRSRRLDSRPRNVE